MKKLCTLAVLLLATNHLLQAQYSRYIVQFTNKNGTPYSLSAPAAFLSDKALARRNKEHIAIDSTDLPITPAYLDSIRKVPNVTLLNVSKWLNQVLIKTTDATNALAKINSFAFVKQASAIAPRVSTGSNTLGAHTPGCKPAGPLRAARDIVSARVWDPTGTATFDYGNSYNQVHIHEGDYLHALGYTGRGITIAIIDAGFYAYLTNPAFDSVRLQGRVLGTWDYVNNEASVNEDNSHGAYVFSTMAANEPGTMVGTAPHASYWLLKTEDPNSEYPVEEQNWAAAAEFADSVGVDMISTSLGYADFDNSAFDHSYAQRNGHTAIISVAATLAAKKGILVAAAAGNSGTSSTDLKYIGCPADADSVLTVGATDNNGGIAPFSCWGPNGAGLLKPNVVSVGWSTVVANFNGTTSYNTGTSFACPNLAGLVACLWQAFPEFTNMEIADAVQKSASQYTTPDFRYGYGLPNFRTAYALLQNQREARTKEGILGDTWIKAYPVPFSNSLNVIFKSPGTGKASLRLVNIIGQVLDTRTVEVTEGEVYMVDYSQVRGLAKGVYYIRYQQGSHKQTLRLLKR
jgi:hypothetical protein